MPREPEPARQVVSVAASEVARARVDWLLPGRVPLGYLTLLIGVQGLGKSQWTCALAANVSRGRHGRAPETGLIASAEDSWETTIKPRLEACEADLDRVRFVKVQLHDGEEDGLRLPADVQLLAQELDACDARLLVLDPVVAHLASDVDSHRDHSTRAALAPLARIADELGCAIVGAHHLNKGGSSDALIRASGSIAFTATARSVLLFAEDPDDPDGENGSGRALAHVKCNVAPLAPTELYQIEPIVLPASGSEPEVETSRVRPVGTSEHSGRELLRAAGLRDFEPEEGSAVDEATAFLRDALAEGPQKTEDLRKEAKAAGIADRTLRRAKEMLNVKSEKIDFAGGWCWVLPKVANDPQEALATFSDGHLGGDGASGAAIRDSGLTADDESPKATNTLVLDTFVEIERLRLAEERGHITRDERLEREGLLLFLEDRESR
jgi:hypothetical protein